MCPAAQEHVTVSSSRGSIYSNFLLPLLKMAVTLYCILLISTGWEFGREGKLRTSVLVELLEAISTILGDEKLTEKTKHLFSIIVGHARTVHKL